MAYDGLHALYAGKGVGLRRHGTRAQSVRTIAPLRAVLSRHADSPMGIPQEPTERRRRATRFGEPRLLSGSLPTGSPEAHGVRSSIPKCKPSIPGSRAQDRIRVRNKLDTYLTPTRGVSPFIKRATPL